MAGRLKFTSILTVVSKTLEVLDDHVQSQLRDLSDVSGIEQNARVVANSMIEKIEKEEL
jgi:1-deoxy-D-xylulose 5-phosphate reductoisomerase